MEYNTVEYNAPVKYNAKKALAKFARIVIIVKCLVQKAQCHKNGSLVKWLRRRPLKAESRVQFPYELCQNRL